ncbi:MAG TPA: glycosyltransferase family 39 protein [Nitrosopumilaceae archaeon]|nr:glycosyltransferase family 39 protein [Nitrosopumilaceae archaeon]
MKHLWKEKPLTLIIFAGLFFRLLSVIFSKGFGMFDDHFLVMEAAQSWVDGTDYNYWLPSILDPSREPQGHSLFYVGIIYCILDFFKFIGLDDAQGKMYFIRLIHALFSLFVIYYGYKIAEKKSGQKVAKMVGIVLALFWMMPFLSVRNLVEVICIPPMMAATWLIIKNEDHPKLKIYMYSGILLGLAFSIRFQTVMFTAGFGLALLFCKKIKEAFITGLFFLLIVFSTQGIIDYFVWHRPFAEFQAYTIYNINNANTFHVGEWYMFILFLAGVMIPPISLFLLFGYFRLWRKQLLLFLPSFVFLAFHSYFPNKQERFILPILPFIITLGFIGWNEFMDSSRFWQKKHKLYKGFLIFFWSLNTTALLFVSVSYSKRNRVEAMYYLSEKKDLRNIVVEDANCDDFTMPPLYYLQKWISPYSVTKKNPTEVFYKKFKILTEEDKPNYVVFMQAENISKRVAIMKFYFPDMEYLTTIEPSTVDKLMHFLNPENNENHTTYIFRIKNAR